jgi:hypothetical protein
MRMRKVKDFGLLFERNAIVGRKAIVWTKIEAEGEWA